MRKIFLVTSILFSLIFSAQNIKVEGFMKDDNGLALETANVMAINTTTKAMDAYNITNDKGRFVLNLKANTQYTIKAGYIGYAPFEKTITTSNESMKFDIVLKSSTDIEAVEIVKEMPVTIKGDTIIYNADSFANGTEKKLEDLLKKLPGMEVNKDGEVEVEGKKAKKLMVNGKDFFDGDTKLGVKNIPADAVSKVEVLRNYNEVANLKGLENNEDDIALNIKLKQGKENFWFGDIMGNLGIADAKSRYLVNPKLFFYNPKFSVNLIGNFNDIGEAPLTWQDYFKFTGGFKNLNRRSGTGFNVSSNEAGIIGVRNDRALRIDSKFGATNLSYNPNKALSISGFGIFSYNKTNTFQENIYNRTDKLPNGSAVSINETRTEDSTQKGELAMAKLSVSYVPSVKKHFDYDILARSSFQVDDNLTSSNIQGDIASVRRQKPFSINQNANYYYTLNDKNVFAFEVQNLFQQEDPFYNASLTMMPFGGTLTGYIPGQSLNRINQERLVNTNKTEAKIDYYYSVTNKANLNITLGNTYSYQKYNSNIFQFLDSGFRNDLNAAENNNRDVKYTFNDAYVGLHYKFLLGEFTFNPGFTFHKFNTEDEQLGSKAGLNFTRFLPDMYIKWDLKKSESITYNYSMTNNFTDINRIVEGYILNGFNSLTSGNRFLQNATSQTHRLNYFKYSMFNMENINASVSYSRQTDIVTNRFQLNGLNQVSESVNMPSNFPNETINGLFNYGRSFLRNYKANANISMNWAKNNNIRILPGNQESIQTNESFTQNYGINFSTNYRNLPNLTVGYNYSINDFQGSKFFTDSPTAKLEYFFLDAFSLVADYSYFNNTNSDKTIKNEYDLLSASFTYRKKGAKLEYGIYATNLINSQVQNNSSFNAVQNATSFTSYFIQPRIVTFGLKYHI